MPPAVGTRLSAVMFLAFAAVVSSQSAYAGPVPIPGLFPTGVDDFGALLAPGAIDPHYALTISSDASFPPPFAYVVADPLPPLWVPNTATAQWINPAGVATTMLTGVYEYEITFDLTGLDPSTAVIFGEWALDDGLIGNTILINGTPTGIVHAYPGFTDLATFAIAAGFVPGINTLTFVTTNEPSTGFNPTGLLVTSLEGIAMVPAPGAVAALMFAALLGRGAHRRRRLLCVH